MNHFLAPGSYQMRMGWHTHPDPMLIFKPVMARTRREKGKCESELLVANDMANIEAFRFNLRTPFDRNVVTQFETMETLLDYGFAHLGMNRQDDEETIMTVARHPIVMTEPVANPNATRGSKCNFFMSRKVFQQEQFNFNLFVMSVA